LVASLLTFHESPRKLVDDVANQAKPVLFGKVEQYRSVLQLFELARAVCGQAFPNAFARSSTSRSGQSGAVPL
jgi:hypothetical protein